MVRVFFISMVLGFTVKHTFWLHNFILNFLSGLTPLKLLTKSKANHCDLLCTNVCCFLVYIPDLKQQVAQKIPKWNVESLLTFRKMFGF